MRQLSLSIAVLLSIIHAPASAFYDASAPDVTVELAVNGDLLRQAEDQGLDLAALLESQLVAALEQPEAAGQAAHEAVIESAFGSLDAIAFGALPLDASSSSHEIETVCKSVVDSIGQLVAQSEARAALPEPATLEEVATLNQELKRHFEAFYAKSEAEKAKLQVSGPILENNCPELKQHQAAVGQAMKTALGPYTPEAWCRALMQKPQSAWSMQDANQFVKACQGVKP